MPIIEPVPEGASLSQGDVLRGIRLFCTGESWNAQGGEANEVRANLCLVVSRPCVAAHKRHLTVVAIEKYDSGIPGDVKSFDDVVGFLKDLRDGSGSPDVFYLGDISGFPGRFAARLDQFFNIEAPSDEHHRSAFLRARRLGRLSIDFVRDLHIRMFGSFAAQGFDDYGWYSTEDLQWIVEKGHSELSGVARELHETRAADVQRGFQGKTLPAQAVAQAEKRFHELKARLDPFANELQRRRGA